MTKTKIYILGAGIGGLSAAHELSKYSDIFDITIIERNAHLGGQAAEIYKNDGETSSICWHAISSSYKYMLNILDEIEDENGIKLISHLRPLDKFIYAMNKSNYIEYGNSFITNGVDKLVSGYKNLYKESIPLLTKLKLLLIYLYIILISKKRLESYDSILWKDLVKSMPKKVKLWILYSTSIYLGMDYNKISVYFIFELLRKRRVLSKLSGDHVFYSFDGSMYDRLFEPWLNHLRDNGVNFMTNTSVIEMHHTDDRYIQSIDIIQNNEIKNLEGDIFINAMDIKNLSQLYPINSKFPDLYKNSRQIQCQVLFYIPYKIQPIGTSPTILILPDSPWFLMIRIESDLWGLQNIDLMSCGIGIWDVNGNNSKNAINCSRKELAEECWDQINKSQHNLKLGEAIPEWDIWHSYQFNKTTGQIDTYEPKFSNNINTLEYRPKTVDSVFTNMFHSTAYTRTNMNIYNMESASEAGVKAARIIIQKNIDDKFTSLNCVMTGLNGADLNCVMNDIDDDYKYADYFTRVVRYIDSIIFTLQYKLLSK